MTQSLTNSAAASGGPRLWVRLAADPQHELTALEKRLLRSDACPAATSFVWADDGRVIRRTGSQIDVFVDALEGRERGAEPPAAWAFEYVDHGRFIRRVGNEADTFAEAAEMLPFVDMAWLAPVYRDQLDTMRPIGRDIGFAYLETFKGNDDAKDEESEAGAA